MVWSVVLKKSPWWTDVSSMEKVERMCESDQPVDDYKALALYLSEVNPRCAAFFQYPSRSYKLIVPVWFENRPFGVNNLPKIMTEISQATGSFKDSPCNSYYF